MQNLDNVHKNSPRPQVMLGNRKGAFNTTVITFENNSYYFYGWSAYYI